MYDACVCMKDARRRGNKHTPHTYTHAYARAHTQRDRYGVLRGHFPKRKREGERERGGEGERAVSFTIRREGGRERERDCARALAK
jgi:hypothetical protein